MMHSLYLAALPAADLFKGGETLVDNTVALLGKAAIAIAAFFFLKQLVRASTTSSVIMALLIGAFVFWGVDKVGDQSVQKPLDETLTQTFNGGVKKG